MERTPRAHGQGPRGEATRWLQIGLITLGIALALNSLLGPLVLNIIEYPLSRTLLLQTVGLEAVSLLVVTPWCFAAAWFLNRGHAYASLIAMPPAAYAAYMFVQYVVGPGYMRYYPWIALHMVVFVLGAAVIVAAWARVRALSVPRLTDRRRVIAGGVLFMAAFTMVQYVPAAVGFAAGAPLAGEASQDPGMYWTIFFLDLGLVVPATIATGIGLLRGVEWAEPAATVVVGWFTLVPVSVAAMGIVMVLGGDPNASGGRIAVLSVGAVAFALFAGWVYRPLIGHSSRAARDHDSGHV